MSVGSYTAKELLEVKGAFFLIILMTLMAVVALVFQYLANIALIVLLVSGLYNAITLVIAYLVYRKKRKGKTVTFLSWVVGGMIVIMPLLARYSYATNFGWTFAVESYHISAITVATVIILQFFYNKKLFVFYFVFVFFNWIAFLLLAYSKGVEMSWHSVVNGQAVHGVVLFREIYYLFTMGLISYISLRNISLVEQYDAKTEKQTTLIRRQAEAQKSITLSIKEMMNSFFSQVHQQNNVIGEFNEKMQSQASSFEEISASLEELLSSSENIANVSLEQLRENERMEGRIGEFRNIKKETTAKLDAALEDMKSVMSNTSEGQEKVEMVEKTISRIKQQSDSISETINVITDIADKINLLSLNASIEAARAGEYGRGFAVVADEIGKLANMTTDSIKEIERVLSNNARMTAEGVEVIQSAAVIIRNLIQNMENSSGKINVLKSSVTEEESYIDSIIGQLMTNIELSRTIGTGTEEQKRAIEASVRAIEYANAMIAEMVGNINHIAASSQSIYRDAEALYSEAQKAGSQEDGEASES